MTDVGAVGLRQLPRAATQARLNPTNRLPASPMKIRDRKLLGRNPRQAPASAAAALTVGNCSGPTSTYRAAREAKVSPAMAATPADRPFMLSRRLKALVIPTIHSSMTGMLSQGVRRKPSVIPG